MNLSLLDPSLAAIIDPQFIYTGYFPNIQYEFFIDNIVIDSSTFTICWTPGHTPGSVVIIYHGIEGDFLFSGDTTMPYEDGDLGKADFTYELDIMTAQMLWLYRSLIEILGFSFDTTLGGFTSGAALTIFSSGKT